LRGGICKLLSEEGYCAGRISVFGWLSACSGFAEEKGIAGALARPVARLAQQNSHKNRPARRRTVRPWAGALPKLAIEFFRHTGLSCKKLRWVLLGFGFLNFFGRQQGGVFKEPAKFLFAGVMMHAGAGGEIFESLVFDFQSLDVNDL
jgi:hypothetical protein